MAIQDSSAAAASPATWTTRRLLDWMSTYLSERNVDDPRLTSELLLSHAFGCERLRLFMEVDRPASKEELSRLRPLLQRAGGHEPVQYVLGEGWFYGRSFEVNRSTLIPRPSTETLVEHVIWHVRKMTGNAGIVPPHSILDIGTGTGCIAITLAKEIPSARIVATDVNDEILALARRNAGKHEVADRIEFRRGATFDALTSGAMGKRELAREESADSGPTARANEVCPCHPETRFDIICSNPPYIPDSEWADVPRNVREHEPESALRGGADGLDTIRPLIAQAAQHLNAGGLLAVEIASARKDEVIRIANDTGFAPAEIVKDHEQKWRVLLARR